MTKIGIIRCEKSLDQCALSSCLRCIYGGKKGVPQTLSLAGIVTCHCPGDEAVKLASQLKAKGAEIIFFCTCAFLETSGEGWIRESVFCEEIDHIVEKICNENGVQCKKIIASLPDSLGKLVC